MPRERRRLVAGGIYHLFDRGNRGQPVVLDDEDRRRYLATLARAAAPRGWSVLAWCLMDNHYHLLIRTPEADLSAGMQELNGSFATWFNRRHTTFGHLWHGRFGDRLVLDEAHLHWEMHYIARNPVRARMVAAAEDYAWSSAGIVLHGLASDLLDREALLRLLSPFDADALHKYRHIVLHGRAPIPPTTPAHLVADGRAADEPPAVGGVSPPSETRGLTPVSLFGETLPVLRAMGSAPRAALVAHLATGASPREALRERLGCSQAGLSKHLEVLEDAGLVRTERDGRSRVYELLPDGLASAEALLRDLRRRGEGQ